MKQKPYSCIIDYTMKMEEGDSMEEFIDSVKNVIMILKNIGEEFSK
jgi:hypothetical protein